MRKIVGILWLFLLLFSNGLVMAQGAEGQNEVSLNTDDTSVFVGQTIIVSVDATISEEVYGYGFQVHYDPSFLRPVYTSSEVGEGYPARAGTLFPSAELILNTDKVATPTSSIIDVVYTQLAPASGVIGTGELNTIQFEVLEAGDTSISVQNVRLIGADEEGAYDTLVRVVRERLTINISTLTTNSDVNQPQPSSEPAVQGTSSSGPYLLVGIAILLTFAFIVVVFIVGNRKRKNA